MNNHRRLISAERRDDDADASLRPQRLSEFINQKKMRASPTVFLKAGEGIATATLIRQGLRELAK